MSALNVATKLIRHWEGMSLTAYPDPGTGGAPWTIGVGATGPGIVKGTVWTAEQAEERLRNDVSKFMAQVKEVITQPATDNQLGAMTSLAYNIGRGNFVSSTLLKKFNNGDIKGAANEFTKWTRAGGKVMQGLVNRREDEKRVFLS